jgi:hypothetical protein
VQAVTFIRGTDPLALLAIQAGEVPTPSVQSGADGNNVFDQPQRAHVIGEPVPIVFGRERNGYGGVFVSPGATECRFENDTDNAVTAFYHLVLSEGQIGQLEARDVFQQQCRVGSAVQTYDRRAGTWEPGNFIVAREGYTMPEASYYCGTVGRYPGISTMAFQVTIPDGFDVWNRQVHVFVRNGMRVRRWHDNQASASSDNFADLAYWLMQKTGRIPESLIDTDSIEAASQFLFTNNITTNCWLRESVNFADLMSRWGKYHLLRLTTVNGRIGLKPLLPVLETGPINTFFQERVYTFTDSLVIPGSVDIRYSSWSSRQPFVAQMIWRQEFEDCPSIIRTSEVRFAGTAPNGPYESHDLSAFCTREEHAVKVGAYILSKRVRSTHTIRFKVRPQSHNTLVTQGSLVRVRLERNPFGGAAGFHDYHYEVERITKTLAGDVQYECSHAPVGEDLRSLIAVDVANAQDSMTFFDCNFTGVGCDINPFDDTTPLPDDEFLIPDIDPIGEIPPLDPGEFPIDIGDLGDPGSPGDGGGDGGGTTLPDSNPDEGIDKRPSVLPGCPNPAQGFYEGQPPLGVPPNIPTIGVFGNLDENGEIIPESIVRIPRIGFSLPFTPPPELGPNILGRDDWNNRFASFEYQDEDGITYITDPCMLLDADPSPPIGPSDDGTYDTSGRGRFSVIATRIGTSTICNCATNVCTSTDLSADTESSLVSPANSIEVIGLDWVGGSKPCGSGNPNFAIPPLIVSRTLPDGTKRNIINTFFGNPFVAAKSVEWSESRSISIRFSDDPDNPVPITDLPKLS